MTPSPTALLPTLSPALYGIDGQIHWPSFFARTAIASVILWPAVRFIGGVSGPRGAFTAFAGGTLVTGAALAWEGTMLRQNPPLTPDAGGVLPEFMNGLGTAAGGPVIDVPYTT